MFAVVKFQTAPEARWHERARAWLRRDSGVTVQTVTLWGLKALQVTITFTCRQKAAMRAEQVGLALEHIADNQVEQVLLPDGCPYTDLLELYGLRQPDPKALLPVMAVPLVEYIAKERGMALGDQMVTLVTPHMKVDAMAAAHALCRRCKALALYGGHDTRAAAGSLRRYYGISVLEQPAPVLAADSGFYLLFDKPAALQPLLMKRDSVIVAVGQGWELPQTGPVLCVDGAHFEPRSGAPAQLVPGVDGQRVLALLAQCGVYNANDLRVSYVTGQGRKMW